MDEAREAFTAAYRITTNNGAFRSRDEVHATVAARLRYHKVKDAAQVAAEFVDDHAFMSRHAGETAGSIAREVADAVVADWYTAPWPQ